MIVTIQGLKLRLSKIPAIPARELLDKMNGDLSALRPYIAMPVGNGEWAPLETESQINKLPNWEVLSLAEAAAYDYNYGFLTTWKAHPVPSQMAVTRYQVAESKNVDPSTAALINAGLATYLELRDKLSLEESFKLLDVLTVKKINEFRAAEANKK